MLVEHELLGDAGVQPGGSVGHGGILVAEQFPGFEVLWTSSGVRGLGSRRRVPMARPGALALLSPLLRKVHRS